MSAKQANVDWATVLKLFAGGALTGAGIGAGTNYLRQLQSLQEQANSEHDTSKDDDVVYLNLPANRLSPPMPKMAAANSASTFALGGLGAATGLYLSYNAVRDIFQKARHRQLQKELDRSQQIYLTGLNNSALQKNASQFNLLSQGVGSAYLVALLTALGSAVATNKILQKKFPPIESPMRGKPRKIVLRSVDPAGTPVTPDEVATPPAVTPDAVEGVLRTHLGNPKAASASGFSDLISAMAVGRQEECKHVLRTAGINGLFSAIKGARFVKSSSLNKNLAISSYVLDPLLSAALNPVLASEFYDQANGLCKLAAYIPPRFQEELVKLSESAVQNVRAGTFGKITSRVKGASALMDTLKGKPFEEVALQQGLSSLLQPNNQQMDQTNQTEQPEEEKGDNPADATNVAFSHDSPEDPHHPEFEIGDDQALAFLHQYGHLIDNALQKA